MANILGIYPHKREAQTILTFLEIIDIILNKREVDTSLTFVIGIW